VDVQIQSDGQNGQRIEGEFYDERHPDIRFSFTGVYKMSFLRVRYKAPQGQKVMEDGDCFLRLQKDGNFAGFYANFDGCGQYELIRMSSASRRIESSANPRLKRTPDGAA
jgi:hypothetical protein